MNFSLVSMLGSPIQGTLSKSVLPSREGDMHRDHKVFEDALHSKNKVILCFFSKEDGAPITRTCAPMDFGPSRRAKDQSDRYHFWDYDSDTVRHTLSLIPGQVISIDVTESGFDPAEFISWNVGTSPWFLKRDWGVFS